jgi:ABC-type Zn2+ transport system substrate-binding protein/surface adhesin
MLTPENIVVLPAAASCRLTEVLAHLHSGDHDDDDDDDHEEHAEHDHEEHAEDDDHADEHAPQHNAFHLRYEYQCDNADALTEVTFPFFNAFENAKEIEAVYITPAGAGSAEIERDTPTLDLSDLN